MSTLTPNDFSTIVRANVFGELKREILRRILASARIARIAKRQVLYRQGDAATDFYIILRGGIKLYQGTAAGHEAVIDVLTKGDALAIADALNRSPHHATAEAISNSRLARIPVDQLICCVKEMPDVALGVLSAVSEHSHKLMRQIAQLKSQSAERRLAEYIASLCSAAGGSDVISLPYNKVLIAGQLGITPESLSRAFASLRSIGIAVKETNVQIGDVSRLREFISEA